MPSSVGAVRRRSPLMAVSSMRTLVPCCESLLIALVPALAQDRELLMALTLIATVLQLVSFLIADICYAVADPRVSYTS